MKVVGIVASPRRDGNTTDMTHHALEWLQKKGVETQVYNLFNFKITPCGVKCSVECYECASASGRVCPIDDEDDLLKVVRIIDEADGVILATPCYSLDVPAHLKAYIERSELHEFNDRIMGIIVLASLGGIHTVSTLTLNLLHHSHPIIAGSAIVTRFYRKRGQAIRDENNRKLVGKLAARMYSALQEKSDGKRCNETE